MTQTRQSYKNSPFNLTLGSIVTLNYAEEGVEKETHEDRIISKMQLLMQIQLHVLFRNANYKCNQTSSYASAPQPV